MTRGLLAAAAAALVTMAPAWAGAATLTTLATFDGGNGAYPMAELAFDPSGNLYGTTSGDLANGGPAYDGTVFKLNKASKWAFSTIATFTGANGSWPRSGVAFDTLGNAFGTTATGGPAPADDGTVFELPRKSTSVRTIAAFASGASGAGPAGVQPKANLVLDAAGNLYGTTSGGSAGAPGCSGKCGTVFMLNKSLHWRLTPLVTFNGANGTDPQSRLVFDAAGNLYGTTIYGGAKDLGTVFRLAPPAAGKTAWRLTTLVTFDATNGANPYAGLVADAGGNLYGTTAAGGANGDGTVFKLAKSAKWPLSTIATFDGTNGAGPRSGLTFDAAGNLYGTTIGAVDGSPPVNDGTVFELKKKSRWAISTVVAFDGAHGAYPFADLVFDAAGNMYGTTLGGGNAACALGCGTVFKITP